MRLMWYPPSTLMFCMLTTCAKYVLFFMLVRAGGQAGGQPTQAVMLCEVDRSYIEDGFNLYGLRHHFANFQGCLDIILDRTGELGLYCGDPLLEACYDIEVYLFLAKCIS